MALKVYPPNTKLQFLRNTNELTLFKQSEVVVMSNKEYLKISASYNYMKVYKLTLLNIPNVIYTMSHVYIPMKEIIFD